MPGDLREQWFAELLDAGLKQSIFAPADVLDHAKPDVLAAHLPADLLADVIDRALAAGGLTPERMLETLEPKVLAKHVPHDVLWACLVAAAERSGISGGNGEVKVSDKRRAFLRIALDSALANKIASTDDVLRHATPGVLASHLPNDLKAKLLAEGLKAKRLDTGLVVEVVGVESMAKHVPMAVIWNCMAEAAKVALDDAGNKKKGGRPVARVTGRADAAPAAREDEFEEDTNVGEQWASVEEFEVVEETDELRTPRPVLGPAGSGALKRGSTGIGPTDPRRK